MHNACKPYYTLQHDHFSFIPGSFFSTLYWKLQKIPANLQKSIETVSENIGYSIYVFARIDMLLYVPLHFYKSSPLFTRFYTLTAFVVYKRGQRLLQYISIRLLYHSERKVQWMCHVRSILDGNFPDFLGITVYCVSKQNQGALSLKSL